MNNEIYNREKAAELRPEPNRAQRRRAARRDRTLRRAAVREEVKAQRKKGRK